MGKENETMKERLKSKKGFTLAELLIVVAIIAVLVAIMIPVFGSSRSSAILSKDAANIRAKYAEEVINAMTNNVYDDSTGKLSVTVDLTGLDISAGTHTDYNKSNNVISVWRDDVGSGKEVKIPVDPDITLTFNGAK